MREAAAVLGKKSAGSLYRKINEGVLPTTGGKIEREGLEELWRRICRDKTHTTQKLAAAADPGGADHPKEGGRKPARAASTQTVETEEEEEADFYTERAKHQREKRLLAELERKQKEGLLVYREDFEAAQAAVIGNLMLNAASLSKQIRTDIPSLTPEECKKIQTRIDDLFRAIADTTFEELDQ